MSARAGKALVIGLALLPFVLVVAGKLLLDDDKPATSQATQNRISSSWETIVRACGEAPRDRSVADAYVSLGKLLTEYDRDPDAEAVLVEGDGTDSVRFALLLVGKRRPGDNAQCADLRARARAALRSTDNKNTLDK